MDNYSRCDWSGSSEATWQITDDNTGDVVLSGAIDGYDCDMYCGSIECLLLVVIHLM